MKTILTFGDSITDMGRDRSLSDRPSRFGLGYPMLLEVALGKEYPCEFQVINKGIGGNRSVDLYARVKEDVWNLKPDYLSILIGVNDVWHEIGNKAGVDLKRFRNVISTLIKETKETLPDVKIILIEPFVLHGVATNENFEAFTEVYQYAKVIKDIAEEYGCAFVPMQEKLNDAAAKYGDAYVLYDGVHPTLFGSRLIEEGVFEILKSFLE